MAAIRRRGTAAVWIGHQKGGKQAACLVVVGNKVEELRDEPVENSKGDQSTMYTPRWDEKGQVISKGVAFGCCNHLRAANYIKDSAF
jgi:hypothetical protein